MQHVQLTTSSTLELQHQAQTNLDWSEFKSAVPKYQLPQLDLSFAASRGTASCKSHRSDMHKSYMARTVSSKARSAGYSMRQSFADSQVLPVSTMYQDRQEAQMWAEVDAEACNLCSSHVSHSQEHVVISNVQPYLRGHTGGLAHTYGSRLRDRPELTADLINSMREASSLPRTPKAMSWIVAKSQLWPASAADGCLTARRQACAHKQH